MKRLIIAAFIAAAGQASAASTNPLAREDVTPVAKKSPYTYDVGVTTHREVYEEFAAGARVMRESAVMNSLHAGVSRAIGESGGRVELAGELGIGKADYTGSYLGGNYGDLHESGLRRSLAAVSAMYKFSAPAWKGFTVGTGLGYRRHVDNLQDAGAGGYQRINERAFLLLGVEQVIPLENWTITPALQYKHIVSSKQKSDLNGGMSVDQPKGYGAQASVAFVRKSEGYSVAYIPFIRTWDIKDSDVHSTGLYEPRNKTSEIGVTVSFVF